jgi:hypothetical protein
LSGEAEQCEELVVAAEDVKFQSWLRRHANIFKALKSHKRTAADQSVDAVAECDDISLDSLC